jgi:SAM-dependent methyltransferase
MTWEQAVGWLRAQPDQQALVRDCYFDDPVEAAAERFLVGEEWQAIRETLRGYLPGRVLDLGAGRGIVTHAFARAGCQVSALEPDPSALVGRGAIETLLEKTGLEADVRGGSAERMPFPDAAFDVVYGRAVLHHARDLEQLCREAARVLRPEGTFLATREHVISRPEDLPVFLAAHPLHRFYGGETAYPLARYVAAIERAGFALERPMGPFDTPINFAPMTRAEVRDMARRRLKQKVGSRLARWLMHLPAVARGQARHLSSECGVPGRHYSFLARKK